MVKHHLFTEDIINSLSPLESFFIESLKQNKKYSSQTVYNLINKNKKISRSSVPVILDRLYNKGLLERER